MPKSCGDAGPHITWDAGLFAQASLVVDRGAADSTMTTAVVAMISAGSVANERGAAPGTPGGLAEEPRQEALPAGEASSRRRRRPTEDGEHGEPPARRRRKEERKEERQPTAPRRSRSEAPQRRAPSEAPQRRAPSEAPQRRARSEAPQRQRPEKSKQWQLAEAEANEKKAAEGVAKATLAREKEELQLVRKLYALSKKKSSMDSENIRLSMTEREQKVVAAEEAWRSLAAESKEAAGKVKQAKEVAALGKRLADSLGQLASACMDKERTCDDSCEAMQKVARALDAALHAPAGNQALTLQLPSLLSLTFHVRVPPAAA